MNELITKLAKATIEVGAFAADKKNSEQNYSYISADAVLDRTGIALAKVGVAVVPSIEGIETNLVERPNKNPRIDTRVTFRMVVTDGESDMVTTWYGMGSDYSTPDKSLYKAITSGHKYFLMKLLNISVGNSDSEHEDDEKPARVTAPQPVSKAAPLAQSNNAPLDDMSIEEAEREYSDHNKCFYGEVETEKLSFMFNGMKKVARPTIDQERKIKAVEIILAARKAGRAVAKFATEVTPAEVDAWVAEQ